MNAPTTRNVRIPRTPELFERLCRDFSALREASLADGRPWPESLDAWAECLADYDRRRCLPDEDRAG